MDKLNFIKTEFSTLLRTLTTETKGEWGMMNAQQMVEHMTYTINHATDDMGTELVTPERHIEKFRAYALGDNDLTVNSKNRMLPEDPIPVRNKDMEAAIQEYESKVEAFVNYFEKNKGATLMNPAFGEFTYDNWLHLMWKHAVHHAKQFALI